MWLQLYGVPSSCGYMNIYELNYIIGRFRIFFTYYAHSLRHVLGFTADRSVHPFKYGLRQLRTFRPGCRAPVNVKLYSEVTKYGDIQTLDD